MASLEVVLFRSSMSMGAKLSILTQEACRRIRNFSPALPWSLKVKEINKLMWQMKEGGYSEGTREIVARRTLGKVRMNMWNLEHLQKPLYRTKELRKDTLKEDKETWFRKMGATSTLMVPTSKNSLLAKKLRLVLVTNPGPRGTSTKVVEVPGPSLFSGLAVNNPFKPERCRRNNCPLLDSGEPCLGKCAKENVLYQAICHKCKPADDEGDGAISQYIGETGRTLYIRRGQHLNDFRKASRQTLNLQRNHNSEETSS